MTYQAEMQAILYEGEQYETLKQNFGTIGTISITIDLQNKPQTSVYTASGTWNNASGFSQCRTSCLTTADTDH